MKIQYHHLISD